MSRAEIAAWISSAKDFDADDDLDTTTTKKVNRTNESDDANWEEFMDIAKTAVLASRTKDRIAFVNEKLLALATRGDITKLQVYDVFDLLTLTYRRYVDAPSREAVISVLEALVKRDEGRGKEDAEAESPASPKLGVTKYVLVWLKKEVEQSGLTSAVSDRFVLLTWCCALYGTLLECAPEVAATPEWAVLVHLFAALLDSILDDASGAKPTLLKAANVHSRRAIRNHPAAIPKVFNVLLAEAKKAQTPLSIAPLLGLTIDVAIRLQSSKATGPDPGKPFVEALKGPILQFFVENALNAKQTVPRHALAAFADFVDRFVTEEDVATTVLPAIEQAIGRGTHGSLLASSSFFSTYSHPIPDTTLSRLQLPLLNCLKSPNADVREATISLYGSLANKASGEQITAASVEITSLLKGGKTTGPDHRVALYKTLATLKPTAETSPNIVSVSLPLLAKETNDAVIAAMEATTIIHLIHTVREGVTLPADVISLLAKEMAGLKINVRRALSNVVGQLFWRIGDDTPPSEASLASLGAFAKGIVPALQTHLKVVSTTPLNPPGGPREGYIAVAILLKWSELAAWKDVVGKNAVIQGIPVPSAKPSFVLWDKVYQKQSEASDEEWLVRAVSRVFTHFQSELGKSDGLRLLVGNVFLHVITQSNSVKTRKEASEVLKRLNESHAALLHQTMRETAVASLQRQASDDLGDQSAIKARFADMLRTISLFAASTAPELREEILEEWVVTAHHPAATQNPRQAWIEMVQTAELNPHKLVTDRLDHSLQLILEASSKDALTAEAAYTAATTLAFVAPEVVVDRLITQILDDLRIDQLNGIGASEYDIWRTPEGTLCVDVLSVKKDTDASTPTIAKGKNQGIEQWEADLRKTLEAKKAKATSSSLSKADRALVDAQLAKESDIRKRVSEAQHRLLRGLALVRALVEADVNEFRGHIATVATLLLEGVLSRAITLVGSGAFDTYLDLGRRCSPRLEGFNKWIGVATLRGFDIPVVPSEMLEEPLDNLVQRVIYRLRTLSETAPFDSATYSYISPFINHVVRNGGIGTSNPDAVMEQVALALNIVDFHCGQCSDASYPRQAIARGLIFAIGRYSNLSKEGSSSLINLGQAIHSNASTTDIAVFIRGTLADEVYVRNACLQAMQPFDMTDLDWSAELWLACHDDDDQNARLATHLWEDNGLDLPEAFVEELVGFLGHEHDYVRRSTPGAFSAAVDVYPTSVSPVLKRLRLLWKEKVADLEPRYDQFGLLVDGSQSDQWQARVAIARTYERLADRFPVEDAVPFLNFLIADKALGDPNSDVRHAVLDAGIAVVDEKGAKSLPAMIATFETYLKKGSSADDTVKEAVVILLGRVARHLGKGDPRVKSVVDRLVTALRTPSEVVQTAVADCLPPLVVRTKGDAPKLVGRLLSELLQAGKYGERRGAAYGVAGAVKGLGIISLQKFDILGRLSTAMEDKKYFESRQGALFAIETLSASLGRLFEPYIIELLPLLLATFGDPSADVREATQDACKVIMANMSGYGVKMILPKLMIGLEDKQWRSKRGCIELLGTMAFCAPKQLSVSLPTVVPRLTEVLKDSHAQVRQAATRSLKQFSEVISNPEIRELVPILQAALVDPEKTPEALKALLDTTFVHYIDTPSLAIVIPIIEGGLKLRGADTKRMAVQIVGNLASLTDSKDFVPHLDILLPHVHQVLVDPVPEARAAAAKSLGTLVERLGESTFPDLVPGLLQTLKTEMSAVDRQGAAQGLSEVLSGLGMERMEGLLPQIIESARSPRPFVREGFMSLLVFLPVTFGQRFTPYLSRIVQPILDGLSDVEELVRTASMKAGRMIINNYSRQATDLLLPQLQKSMFDESWRIRLSSLTLVGELLYKLAGISGKVGADEEEEEVAVNTAEPSRRVLADVLGKERRDLVLAVLFVARQDGVSSVRQASSHIWKALVNNTPRTIRDILPSLVQEITELLVTAGEDQQETAATTMGELCRKFGERMLGDIVNILRTCSQSSNAQTREGACLAISEVMESTNEETMEDYETQIISIVRSALVDESPKVRAAAATAFDALQKHIGTKAIDQTIPTLLGALRQAGPGSDTALHALKEIMTVRASSVFPVLIPTLIATPMTAFNARALSQLVVVAGDALSKRLNQILQAIVLSMETEKDEEVREAVEEASRQLLESISDDEGLNTLMSILLDWAKNGSPQRRASAAELFGVFCEVAEVDFVMYRVDWIRRLVIMLDDGHAEVVENASIALDAFVKSMDKDDLESLVVPLRRTIESTGASGRHVPGFKLKGLSPMVPIILAGLTGGSSDQREQAAYAIGDLVEKTDEADIKPFTTQLTGPLIRVITQATTLPPAVKSAILSALTTMLDVIPTFIKPFFPQLQRTFCKSLVDPASLGVRTRAGTALGSLFKSQPRVDPLITELVTTIRATDEDPISASVVLGLANVVRSARDNVGSSSRKLLGEVIEGMFTSPHEDALLSAVAQLFTAMTFDLDAVRDIVSNHLVIGTPPNALTSRILAEATANTPKVFYDLRCVLPMARQVVACVGSNESSISRPAREAREALRTHQPFVGDTALQAIF